MLGRCKTFHFRADYPAIPIVTDYYSQEYEYEAYNTELKAARSQPDARNGTVQDDPVPVRLQANSSITAHDTARVLQGMLRSVMSHTADETHFTS